MPELGRMLPGRAYEGLGVVLAARILFAVTLGAFLGTVIRRTVPAMAATLIGTLGLTFVTQSYLRGYFLSPVTGPEPLAGSNGKQLGLVVKDWWADPAGHALSQSRQNALISQATGAGQNVSDWLTARHYSLWADYQPPSRFWALQIIEGGGLAVLALVLGAATIWWVRRRVT